MRYSVNPNPKHCDPTAIALQPHCNRTATVLPTPPLPACLLPGFVSAWRSLAAGLAGQDEALHALLCGLHGFVQVCLEETTGAGVEALRGALEQGCLDVVLLGELKGSSGDSSFRSTGESENPAVTHATHRATHPFYFRNSVHIW